MYRLTIAAAVVLASAAPGLAQTCWSGPNGMVMCSDGFMAMGGMWMRLPSPQVGAIVSAPGAPATRWWQRWSVAPDGSRREVWESETQLPDGRILREAQTRIVFPDGRVCVQHGPALECE
ncbi:MAG: hypothetical protein JNK46_15905 [Methylobacteriaceae bacterium]|nr:hypothetical protein [Methylobacteriaceae bacterium]